jgi:hypothetical protein
VALGAGMRLQGIEQAERQEQQPEPKKSEPNDSKE